MAVSLTLDPSHSALLIMDYQNDILGRLGAAAQGLLDRATTVLTSARAAGLPIIYVVVQFRPGYPEVSPRSPAFAAIKGSGRMLRERPAPQFIRRWRLAPRMWW